MTGLVGRFPRLSIRLVRTSIEVLVLGIGFLLGGTVGIGTVAYALAIGPLAHVFMPLLHGARTATAAPDAATTVALTSVRDGPGELSRSIVRAADTAW